MRFASPPRHGCYLIQPIYSRRADKTREREKRGVGRVPGAKMFQSRINARRVWCLRCRRATVEYMSSFSPCASSSGIIIHCC